MGCLPSNKSLHLLFHITQHTIMSVGHTLLLAESPVTAQASQLSIKFNPKAMAEWLMWLRHTCRAHEQPKNTCSLDSSTMHVWHIGWIGMPLADSDTWVGRVFEASFHMNDFTLGQALDLQIAGQTCGRSIGGERLRLTSFPELAS